MKHLIELSFIVVVAIIVGNLLFALTNFLLIS